MQMEQFREVYASALKFLVPRTPQETYITIVREAIRLIDATDGSLFMPKGNTEDVVRVYTTNKKLYRVKPRAQGLTNTTFQSGVASIRNRKELTRNHPSFKKTEYESDITVPLVYSHITMGVISLLKADGEFTEKDLELMNHFAPLATLAIRNAHLNNELTKAVEMRDIFISTAAHEFKNPISVILLATEMLLKKVNDNKDVKSTDLEYLNTNVQKLSRMIDELMNVSQIKKGKLKYKMKKIELNDVLTTNVDAFRKSTDSHKLLLSRLSKKSYVKADIDKLNRVIVNVLSNAEKFSPEGSKIYCQLQKSGNYFLISIRDQGQGIDQRDLSKIFEHFYRGTQDGNKPGMGLGLYLVKNIVHDHGGKVEIQSILNKGTTVKIYLPVLK